MKRVALMLLWTSLTAADFAAPPEYRVMGPDIFDAEIAARLVAFVDSRAP
ncbi:MAG: hypothetical protein H7343_16305 [Undibacterium sp.]|nr:hypothetical protein [Opitutaceae bacterium]